MHNGNQIPTWATRSQKKTAQFNDMNDAGPEDAPKMVRYRGTMIYEVTVPENLDVQQEQALADEKAHELWKSIWDQHGDAVPTADSPTRMGF